MSTPLILGTVGAIVGNLIVPGIGGQIGWVAGTLIGSAIDPVKVVGPRLNRLQGVDSSYGLDIPRIYGTVRMGANRIWRKVPLDEHEHTDNGKGGPETTTFSYSTSYDDMIAERANVVLKIWANGRLKWTSHVTEPDNMPFVFYDGNSSQTADPTEEAIIGAGLVPAYRGVARVVFTDQDLTEFGNTLPQNNYLVSAGPFAEASLTYLVDFRPWPDLAADAGAGRFPGCSMDDDDIITVVQWPVSSQVSGATTATRTTQTYDIDGNQLSDVDDVIAVGGGFDGQTYFQTNYSAIQAREDRSSPGGTNHWTWAWVVDGVGYSVLNPQFTDELNRFTIARSELCIHIDKPGFDDRSAWTVGRHVDTGVGYSVLQKYPFSGAVPALSPSAFYQFANESTDVIRQVVGGEDGYVYVIGDSASPSLAKIWKFDRDLNLLASGTPAGVEPDSANTINLTARKCVVCSDGTWIAMIKDPSVLRHDYRRMTLADDLSSFDTIETLLKTSPNEIGPYSCISLGHGMVLSGNGLMPACPQEGEGGPEDLADIVADICQQDGLDASQYDVTDLENIPVRGCVKDRTMTGRAFIEMLMPLFYFDAVESDGAIKFVRRGKPFAVEIPDEDLAAHMEDEPIPAKLQIVRGQDEDLNSHITINYWNPDADYMIGSQQWHRQTGNSKVETTINAPVVFTDAEAKQIVEALGFNAWNERDRYVWFTTRKYAQYEPTDVVRVQGIDIHVRQKSESPRGIIRWEGVRAHAGAFVQPGIPGASEGFPEPEIPDAQETELALLDGPFLGDDWRHGLIPVVAQGALRRSWRGMSLQKSLDGTNYSQILSESSAGTIGEAVTTLPAYGGISFDEGSVLRVLIHPGGGELVSVSRNAAFAGENMAMLGAEIINYRTAAFVSEDEDGAVYDLTGILRGRYGTAWAMRGHGPSLDSPTTPERFVALPSASSMALLRSDLGITRQYKPVTNGRTLASATAYPFRSNGIPLAPYAPHFLAGAQAIVDSNPAFLMRWVRCSRINQGWVNFRSPTGMGQPLGEETEAYRVRIWADGTFQSVVRTETVMDATEFTYTEDMQTDDFGSPLPSTFAWSVAQIGTLGPGYESFSNGFVADLPLFVPATVPGYVPPNPPSGDWTTDTMPWVEATQRNYAGLEANDTLVIQFTTGNVDSGAGGLVQLTGAELGGPPVPRQWTLSPTAGDFGPQPMPGAYSSGSPSITALFVVGSGPDYGYYPTVPKLATWYLNIRNLPSGYVANPLFVRLLNVP